MQFLSDKMHKYSKFNILRKIKAIYYTYWNSL